MNTLHPEDDIADLISRFRRRQGMAIVFSGPSGVGKDAVLSEFLPTDPQVVRLVTATTRPMRDGETDGVDYHFLSEGEFERMREEGKLLEWARVYDHHYCSPRTFVDDMRRDGKDVILKLDVQGGLSVSQVLPEAVMVFLAPPSMQELERRITGRKTETAASLATRLAKARSEMELISHYHYLIVNNTVRQACDDLAVIIDAERQKVILDE